MPFVSSVEALNLAHVRLPELLADLGAAPWRKPLVGTDRVRGVLMFTPPGTSMAAHLHPHADETFHVLSGRAGFIFDGGEEHVAGAGSVLFAPRGVRHAVRVLDEEPLLWIAFITPNEDVTDEQVD